MKFKQFLIGAALIASAACHVHAQETVLKGSQVTESALIEALTIEGPEAASGATRGFRPAARSDGKAPKAGPGKANLLITFATNSSDLTGESQAALDALARADGVPMGSILHDGTTASAPPDNCSTRSRIVAC